MDLQNFDKIMIIGLLGQIVFSARFIVQWIESERKKESTIPFSFWILSITGSALLLIYAIYRKDIVFILGQGPNILIYSRNIYMIKKKKNN